MLPRTSNRTSSELSRVRDKRHELYKYSDYATVKLQRDRLFAGELSVRGWHRSRETFPLMQRASLLAGDYGNKTDLGVPRTCTL